MITPTEPLADILTRVYGPSSPRSGVRSDRPWWRCPFHDDKNPSLSVIPGTELWKCFGCGQSGDAIAFVRKLHPEISFRQARESIGGGSEPTSGPLTNNVRRRPPPSPPARPEGWRGFVGGLVDQAERCLWDEAGIAAIDYLRRRGLNEATIRAARLGFWPEDSSIPGPFRRPIFISQGIFIPWFEDGAVEAVKIRRLVADTPDGKILIGRAKDKYRQIQGSRGGLYPGKRIILPGRGLILAEGEFDALLLNQELSGLLPVVTLGSASSRRPDRSALLSMCVASPWYIAGDADDAGHVASQAWDKASDRTFRVSPPRGKDWTDSFLSGVDLKLFWSQQAGRTSLSQPRMPQPWMRERATEVGPEVAEVTAGGNPAGTPGPDRPATGRTDLAPATRVKWDPSFGPEPEPVGMPPANPGRKMKVMVRKNGSLKIREAIPSAPLPRGAYAWSLEGEERWIKFPPEVEVLNLARGDGSRSEDRQGTLF
jgi:hypothetical protein